MKLVRQTYGIFGMLPQLPYGLKIWRKKPEVARRPPPIEGREELEGIYRELDREGER